MFHTMTREDLTCAPNLRASMLRDRAHQFVQRHAWRLHVDAKGFELDEYDDERTTYCVVEQSNRHAASLRLRAAKDGSMVEHHFGDLWEHSRLQIEGSTEVTRFCASGDLVPGDRDAAISDLLIGLCDHCMTSGIPSFFGVIFPSVARVLSRLRWPPEVLAKTQHDGQTLLLAKWQANAFVAFDLQCARKQLRERAQTPLEQRAAA